VRGDGAAPGGSHLPNSVGGMKRRQKSWRQRKRELGEGSGGFLDTGGVWGGGMKNSPCLSEMSSGALGRWTQRHQVGKKGGTRILLARSPRTGRKGRRWAIAARKREDWWGGGERGRGEKRKAGGGKDTGDNPIAARVDEGGSQHRGEIKYEEGTNWEVSTVVLST